ncbi:MAG: class I SAM-dependent methyltransferase [Methylotetracoccus sp.]
MPHSDSCRYDYQFDPDGNDTGAWVIRLTGRGRRVLELGAGPGSITRHLVDPGGCDVTALEFDADAVERLKAFCPRVVRGDLNDPAWPAALPDPAPFDVIVAADVLEHLYDPWRTLGTMKSMIAPGGHVVVSLPHIAHVAVVAGLLQERFDYREQGLLDRTHIRFFTIHGMQALFEQAGLSIVAAEFVRRDPEQTEFAEHWNNLPAEIRSLLSVNPFGTVYQVVVKAAPSEAVERALSLIDSTPDGSSARRLSGWHDGLPTDPLAGFFEARQQAEELSDELRGREREIDALRAQLARHDEELRAMRDSTSWKIGAPIRWLARVRDFFWR